jgi:CrcB protein
MNPLLLVGLGGVLGANARYLISTWAAGRFGTAFPYGTFGINASGSLLIGFLLTVVVDRLGNDPAARWLVATGFLGAYTTFSTFAYETVALLRQGDIRPALTNALGSAALGVSGCLAGILLAEFIAGRVA